jgi:thiamine-phosphate pyrophosphorylase
MKLIVISNPVNLNNEHDLLCSLFEAGLDLFHLRKPGLTYEELERYIQLIPQQHRNRVILHSHHQLTVEYKLKGIHFTAHDPYIGSDIFPAELQRSASLHSLEEIKNVNPDFKYVFLSPVFDSISKAAYKSKFDLEELKSSALLRRGTGVEIIALGGIDEHTIAEAISFGFKGVAVLGAVWMSDDPLKKFKELKISLEAVNKNKIIHHA